MFGTVLMCLCLPVGCFILKGENYGFLKDKILEKGNGPIQEESNVIWKEMSSITRRVGKEILGESKGFWLQAKESLWWNGEVQNALREANTILSLANR